MSKSDDFAREVLVKAQSSIFKQKCKNAVFDDPCQRKWTSKSDPGFSKASKRALKTICKINQKSISKEVKKGFGLRAANFSKVAVFVRASFKFLNLS